jgi:hypothetical protein
MCARARVCQIKLVRKGEEKATDGRKGN